MIRALGQKFRRTSAIVILFAIVLVVVWSWSTRHGQTSTSPQSTQPAHVEPQVASPALPALGQADSLQSPEDDGDLMTKVVITPAHDPMDPASRAMAVAKLEQTIQNYRATMTYPLSSRPADASNAYLTSWNRAISVGQSFAVDAIAREISVTARIDRVFAAPGAAVAVQVSAAYVTDGAPAPLDEVGASLQWYDPRARDWVTAQPVPVLRGPDGWTGSIVPSQVPALKAAVRASRISVLARSGGFSRELALDFAYAADPPITIARIAHDQVRDGNLEIVLDAQLPTTSPVRLIATLFASDGKTPIAVHDDRYFPDHAGWQAIPVQFFGKILHDRQIDGPYRLGAVHGYVYLQDHSPDELWFDRSEDPPMLTARYSAASFSAAAYHSPDTDAMLARYQAMHDALSTSASR